jgi:hypothetical protein
MRKLSLSLVVVASMATAVYSPPQAGASTIPYEKIPLLPKDSTADDTPSRPSVDKIPATEKMDGVFPAVLPEAKRKDEEKEGYRYIQVFTTANDARDYAVDGTYNAPLGTTPAAAQCLSSDEDRGLSQRLRFYMRTKPYAWEEEWAKKHKPRVVKKPTPPPKPTDQIHLIHGEKMTVDGDSVTVDTFEALIDLNTLGVRQLSKKSVKLAKVASGPGGMGIFAGHDEKGTIQFLATHPELPKPPSDDVKEDFVERLGDSAERLFVQTPGGSNTESGCGHARFTMASKQGGGQMASVFANAFLPPAQDLDEAPAEPVEKTENSDEGEFTEQQAERKRRMRVQRIRPFAANLSVSQLASEQSPLLSVTFGWTGKDDKVRF